MRPDWGSEAPLNSVGFSAIVVPLPTGQEAGLFGQAAYVGGTAAVSEGIGNQLSRALGKSWRRDHAWQLDCQMCQ